MWRSTSRRASGRRHEDWLALAASFALALQLALLGVAAFLAALPGWSAVAIESGSMEPLLHVGDVALVHPAEHPEPGEVVLVARAGEVPLLHRVIRWNADGTATTKGDANAQSDSTPVGAGEIVGAGRVALPAIGMPSVWWAHGEFGELAAAIGLELALVICAARGALRNRRNDLVVSGLIPLGDRSIHELHTTLPDWVRVPAHPFSRPWP